MSLQYIYELRKQPVLIAATTAAVMQLSRDIQSEAANTPNHAARLAWSLQPPEVNAQAIMPSVAMNGSVQTKWAERMQLGQEEWLRFDDNDILFIVSSWINAYVLD